MSVVLLTLDNVNLDGNCVMALLDKEYGNIKWVDSVDYLGITAVKAITRFNNFFVAIVECQIRESKICIFSEKFECIEIIYRKEISSVKSIYSDNNTIFVGGKGNLWEIKIDSFGHFTECSTRFTYNLDYTFTSIVAFQGKLLCSLFNESTYTGKIIDISSEKSLCEVSGIPRSLIVRHDCLIFLDAHNSVIHLIEDGKNREIPIHRGHLSVIREVNGTLLMTSSAWRAYTRRSNRARGNWQNFPKWAKDKSYPDIYSCDLVELNDNFEPGEVYSLSHVADEISGLIPMPEVTIPKKTGAEAKRAILLKHQYQSSMSKMRKQLAQSITSQADSSKKKMTSEQVSDLCSQAVAARQDGNHQLALHKYEEIIKINPNYLAAYIETGVELTKLERYSEAEERFRQVLKNEPNHRGVLVAYAASARRQGKRELALKRFEDVIDKHPNYLEGYIEVGIELGELGRYLEAEERFQQVLKKKPNHVIASIHRQCYKFLFGYTPQTIKSKLEVIKSYRSEEDLIELKDYLASRIKHHKPTSAIRLGDGEGNVLALCLKSLDKYKDFKFNCLKRSLGIWFGANRQFTDHEFLVEISQELQSVIDNSDVIGMPYFSRIQQEYRRDNRGYSGVADVVNYFYDFREKASSKVIANVNFHILFHKYDLYKSLLRDLDFCGLITCHRELAEKVRSLFAIKNIRSYYIPGEKCQYKILSTESLSGTHYPNRYRELIKELEVPFEGACFLVAGGILGKLYCNLIKNQGGIALDIGSAADLWMGYKTRDFSVLESR